MSVATDPETGRCTSNDIEVLDAAIDEWREAEEVARKAKVKVGKIMKRLRRKGAQRRWLARRADVSDQTVTHLTEGRKNWRLEKERRNGSHA